METAVDPIPVLDALVRIRSHEQVGEAAAHLAGRLEKLARHGVRLTVTDVPGQESGQRNVRAEWGEGKRSLTLNSHMDTVPPSAEWTTDPFVPVVEGDRFTALGAADAKGCLASMLAAFETVVSTVSPDRGRLVYSAVALEEGAGLGAQAEVARGLRTDAVIVGEPTDLEVCVAHKGVLRMRVTVIGKAAHASEPWEGRNAIVGMRVVLDELERLSARVSERSEEPVGRATLAVTMIEGGTAQNVIPAKCVLVLDRRLLPRESAAEARAEIQNAVSTALREAGLSGGVKEISLGDSASTPADSDVARTVLSALAANTGGVHRTRGFGACCDMYHFARAGGMPTVILGPGSLSQAHHAQEWVSPTEVRRAPAVYTDIIRRWFGVTQD